MALQVEMESLLRYSLSSDWNPIYRPPDAWLINMIILTFYRDQKYNGVWKIPTLSDYLDVIQVRA